MKSCPRCHLRYPDVATKCFVDGTQLTPLRDRWIGTVLAGRYEIEDVIARGGMSTVYVASQRPDDTRCAVKIISDSLVRNRVILERFRREARSTQQLAHPNIIDIIDAGETSDGHPYIVMELLEGRTLSAIVGKTPLPLADALPIAVQTTRALARAHDFDVIHRDLKPENIFLCETDGSVPLVKLLDFGIALSLHDPRLTTSGEVFGTPQYMAPERVDSLDAGPAADLYSLGVILFEMLTGVLPFVADNGPTCLAMHLTEPVPTLKDKGVDMPPSVESLVAALLEKSPQKRPVDAHVVHELLVGICRTENITVPPEPTPRKTKSVTNSATDASPSRWEHRLDLFDRMLPMVYGNQPPDDATKQLGTMRKLVETLRQATTQLAAIERRRSAIEKASRKGRQQFGTAVDALGGDVSRARQAARTTRQQAESKASELVAFADSFRAIHEQVLLWEGRTAFSNPHPQLSEAYRHAAKHVDAWVAVKLKADELTKQANALDAQVVDLEYQLNELRSGLTRLEMSSDEDRTKLEMEAAHRSQHIQAIQNQFTDLATKFCDPIRDNEKVSELFRNLS